MSVRTAAAAAAAAIIGGCAAPLPSIETPLEARTEAHPWAAVSHAPTGPPVYLGNGYFGIRLSAAGSGEGLPCLALVDSALIRLQNPAQISISADGVLLSPKSASLYRSWLDFRAGIYSVYWEQSIPGGSVSVKVESVCHPQKPVLSQKFTATASSPSEFIASSGKVGRFTAEPVSATEAEPRGMDWSCSALPAKARANTFTFERTCSLSDSLPSFDETVAASKAFLTKRWRTDIRIDGPVEDQQAVRSFLFNLYISGNEKLPPMALSSERYKGHRFWDAEAWLLPVYALVQPEIAQSATAWRVENSFLDARIPWEAGRGGTDVTPPEFRRALHVSGWVSWWLARAMAMDLADAAGAKALQRSIAEDFYGAATHRQGAAELLSVISPDEGRVRDNDLSTNLLAKFAALQAAKSMRRNEAKRMREFADSIAIPRNASDDLPSTYDNDHLNKYQQAAALLTLYPLEWPFDAETAQRMYERYKDKISGAGPAMSDSIHATIAARMGRAEEAYGFWKSSWEPFVRPETMQFCERRATDDCYFATGAAGCLQSVIYGFLGVRITDAGVTGSPSKALLDGYSLSVSPNLPKAWKSITFTGVQILGEAYTIRATHSGASIEKEGQ